MAFSLDIAVLDRMHDRVHVDVHVAPLNGLATVDGVALELQARTGERLSCRMLLPVAGQLTGPVNTRIELRAHGCLIPRGARVVGTAWAGSEAMVEASCPTDPCTHLESYLKGSRPVLPTKRRGFAPEELTQADRCRLARAFPWLLSFKSCNKLEKPTVLDEDVDERIDDVARQLGLDEDCKAWLRDLLKEE